MSLVLRSGCIFISVLQHLLLSTSISVCLVTLPYFNCQSWLQDPELLANEKAAIYSWIDMYVW